MGFGPEKEDFSTIEPSLLNDQMNAQGLSNATWTNLRAL
jgi:hypothetical protein